MSDRRALVAEDSLLILIDLETVLGGCGIEIVGPASTLQETLALADADIADIALLDINLNGEMVYPAADILIERGVPVIFTTGYDGAVLPPQYWDVPIVRKPYKDSELLDLVEKAFALSRRHWRDNRAVVSPARHS